jgi:hypothetical protein
MSPAPPAAANLRNIVAYRGEIRRIGESMRAQPRPR